MGARRSGDASLGHASLTRLTRLFQAGFQPPWKANYDWLLGQAASPFQPPWKANYDWLLAYTTSPFWKANYDWLLTQIAFLFSCAAVTFSEACGAAYFPCCWIGCRDLVKVQGKLGRHDFLREGERGQESNRCGCCKGGRPQF